MEEYRRRKEVDKSLLLNLILKFNGAVRVEILLKYLGIGFWNSFFFMYNAGTRNGKSVPTVYNGNGTQFSVPFPLYTVGTLLPFLVPGTMTKLWRLRSRVTRNHWFGMGLKNLVFWWCFRNLQIEIPTFKRLKFDHTSSPASPDHNWTKLQNLLWFTLLRSWEGQFMKSIDHEALKSVCTVSKIISGLKVFLKFSSI